MKRSTIPPSLAWSLSINPLMSRLLALVVTALFVLILLWVFSDALRQFEERLGSQAWVWFPETQTEERITIVAIDEPSLAEIGSWPWSRQTFDQLSDRLVEAGASQQIYDIVLPEHRAGDAALADTLNKHNAVLAQVPLLQSQQALQAGVMSNAIKGMQCQPPMPSTSRFLANAAAYQSVGKGHITPIVDDDGMIRRVPPLICVQGRVYPSLALVALLQGLGMNHHQLSLDQVSLVPGRGLLAPSWQLILKKAPQIKIPLDQQGNMRISYRRAVTSFAQVSAVDVLNQPAAEIAFDHTWALIGATAFGLGDVVPTPQSALTPGVELQARMMGSLLDDEVPYTPKGADALQWLLGGVVLLLLLGLAARPGKGSFIGLPLAGLLIPCALLSLHGVLLLEANLWLGWLPVALFAVVGSFALLLLEYGRVRHERLRVYSNLSSYLPEHVAHEIAFHQPNGAISAKRQKLVVLCADIRNYSIYQESRTPEEAATLLHCFFVEATHIVEAHGGSIHEFKGDALIATWPVDQCDNAVQLALTASSELVKTMQEILPQHASAGSEPMSIGIGIEMGQGLVGSIGPAHRRHHALMGTPLTAALRIQSMTAELGQAVLIGEVAAQQFTNGQPLPQGQPAHGQQAVDRQLESQGAYMLEGIQYPMKLYAFSPGTLPDPVLPKEATVVVDFEAYSRPKSSL